MRFNTVVSTAALGPSENSELFCEADVGLDIFRGILAQGRDGTRGGGIRGFLTGGGVASWTTPHESSDHIYIYISIYIHRHLCLGPVFLKLLFSEI